MKIGVMSDTHGNTRFIKEVSAILLETERVAKIYHLGDSYQDSRKLLKYDIPVVGVPGLYDPEYFEPIYENQITDHSGGFDFLLIHDRAKVRPGDLKKVNAVLFGHTHTAAVSRDENNIVWFNPGHLKAPIDKQQVPTFGILDIDEDYGITASVRDLKNGVLQEKKFVM